jgi:hypothetical protein
VPWIPAKRSLSIIDDGLNTDWHGRVWMNPPYSAPTPWIDKFIEHGNGICLIACSRSGSFYKLWDMADAFMGLPMPLIKFVTAGGESKGIFMPVILAAMGATNVEVMRDSKLAVSDNSYPQWRKTCGQHAQSPFNLSTLLQCG